MFALPFTCLACAGSETRAAALCPAARLARFRQKRRLGFAPQPLLDLIGVVGPRRIAAHMAQAKLFHSLGLAVHRPRDPLDPGTLLMPGGQIEGHRPAAPAATLAVALAQLGDALPLLLVLPERPRADISGEERATHNRGNTRRASPKNYRSSRAQLCSRLSISPRAANQSLAFALNRKIEKTTSRIRLSTSTALIGVV
jgi:hypothetical protein